MGTVTGHKTFYLDGTEVGEIKEMELTGFSDEEMKRYWPFRNDLTFTLTGKLNFWDAVALYGIKRIGAERKLFGLR